MMYAVNDQLLYNLFEVFIIQTISFLSAEVPSRFEQRVGQTVIPSENKKKFSSTVELRERIQYIRRQTGVYVYRMLTTTSTLESSRVIAISHTLLMPLALFRSQNTGNIINEIKFNLTWKCKHKFFNRIVLMDVDK